MYNFSGQLRSNFEPTNNNSTRFFSRSSNSAFNLPISNSKFYNLKSSRASIVTPTTGQASSPYFRQPLASVSELSVHPSHTSRSFCASRISSLTDKNGNSYFSSSMISISSTILNLPTYTQQFSKTLILFEVFGTFHYFYIFSSSKRENNF